MNRSGSITIAVIAIVLVMLICACIAFIGGAGYIIYNAIGQITPAVEYSGNPTRTPQLIRPTIESQPTQEATLEATPEVGGPNQPPEATATRSSASPTATPQAASISTDTLKTLENSIVPINDPVDLAERLKGVENIPATMTPPASPYKVGDTQKFYVTKQDNTSTTFQIDATLQYVTAHVYLWVQNGTRYNQAGYRTLVDTFENKIYPTDREFFGSEWTPGIDGDVHIYILLARDVGASVAGYFSDKDEYPPQAQKYSNAHEMFILNADNQANADQDTYGTLAHEFQHMIHWYRDRNETSWVNEGFSMLAEFLNGYPTNFEYYYAQNPDWQLTDWAPTPDENIAHYGESFLFFNYFLDRFGEKATQALVADPQNDMESVDDVLKQENAKDGLTGKPITANDVFLDWIITNFLHDGSVADGRFTYHDNPNIPSFDANETLTTCPVDNQTRDVHQYGADYVKISCPGDYTLHFEGSTMVKVVDTQAHSGKYFFWSNKGDVSDMTLTRQFDFSNQSGPINISYWTWYDIEKDYDYVYFEASTDGKTWEILKTPSGTGDDPVGNSYGWGYNAKSGSGPNWIQENVDLSKFAGKKVQLRFEYITDAAVNGEGFLLDDVSVPAVNYSTDFEKDDGGWQGAGFVRVENVLPQTFALALITKNSKTTVDYITLKPDMTADVPIHVAAGGEVTLVIGGTTRYTRQTATYSYSVRSK